MSTRFPARKELLIIIASALIAVVPILWLTSSETFRLDSDYDAILPVYDYVVRYSRESGRLPHVFPYAFAGIPLAGDPISLLFEPFFSIPVLIFGVDYGVRVFISLCLILSGVSMWALLRSVGISGWLGVFGSTLYQFSGPVGASIAAGHLGKLMSYGLLPLFIRYLLLPARTVRDMLVMGCILLFMLLSSDVYYVWFALLFFVCLTVYRGVRSGSGWLSHFREIPFLLGFFFLLSSWKIYLFATDILPQFMRSIPDFRDGSIHAWLSFIPFIMPLETSFYDRPFFQRLLGFRYNWYEYYAFISPFPLFYLIGLRKVFHQRTVQLVLVLLVVTAAYLSLKHLYSPFYWVFSAFPFLQALRVPQRIVFPAVSVGLVLSMLCAKSLIQRSGFWKGMSVFIAAGSLISVLTAFTMTLYGTFRPPYRGEYELARKLRQSDASRYYVANFICCIQRYLAGESIPIVNYYYGWRSNAVPGYLGEDGSSYDFSVLKLERPKYIINGKTGDFRNFGYTKYWENEKGIIWVTDSPTIIPDPV